MTTNTNLLTVGVTGSGRGWLGLRHGVTIAEPNTGPDGGPGGAPAGGGAGTAGGTATESFANVGGGPVLRDVELQPVFWGTGWAPPSNQPTTEPFSVQQMVDKLRVMASTPYLTGLAEYGCTGTVTVRDPIVWNDDDITGIAATDVARGQAIIDRLLNAIDKEDLPEPDEAPQGLVYAIILTSAAPWTVQVVGAAPPNNTIVGENWHADFSDRSEYLVGDYDTYQPVHYFWVGVPTGTVGNYTPLNAATKTAAHELVEKMTDPGPDDGYRNQITLVPGDTQIGDPASCNKAGAVVDGVAVQPYWSQQAAGGAGAPVLPCRTRNSFPRVSLQSATAVTGPPEQAEQKVLCPIMITVNVGFTTDTVTQTFQIDSNPIGFDNPVATFAVLGTTLAAPRGGASGAPTGSFSTNVTGSVPVTPPGQRDPVDAKVTLACSVSNNTLTITNMTFEGAFDLPVAIDITEYNLGSVPVPIHASATPTVPFATKVRTLDQASRAKLEQCTHERARISAGALQQELGHFPGPGGDPGPIVEQVQRLYADLLDARVERRALRLARGPAFGARPNATTPSPGR